MNTSRSSVCVAGSRLPVRMKNGHARPSASSRSRAAARRTSRWSSRPRRRRCRGSRRTGRARSAPGRPSTTARKSATCASLIASRVAPGRRLHRRGRDHLHQVVDDDVAQRADRVVEVAAVLDAEVLRHRDLDGLEVVAVPDRLEHRVREPEVEDLLEAHLPEVVVDPVELRLVDVLVQLVGELAWPRRGRGRTASRRPPARCSVSPASAQPLDDPAEEERRDLEVEDGLLRRRRSPRPPARRWRRRRSRPRRRRTGRRSRSKTSASSCSPVPTIESRARSLQLVDRPVVDGHADDRAVEQAARARAGRASGRSSPSPGRR